MNILDVKSAADRDKGWAIVKIDISDPSLVGYCLLIIERKMHSKPFLTRDGWQVSESRLKLETNTNDDGSTDIFFDPELTHYLDAGNYSFHLFSLDSVLFGESIMRWKGFPRVSKKLKVNNDLESIPSFSSGNSSDSIIEGIGSTNEPKLFDQSFFDNNAVRSDLLKDQVFGNDASLASNDSKDGINDISLDAVDIIKDSVLHLNPDEYPVFEKVQIFTCYQCKNKIFHGLKSCLFCGANY